MVIVEQLSLSKYGDNEHNEDIIYVRDGLVAIIDGATSKTNKTLNGMTSGRFAAKVLENALSELNLSLSPFQILSEINGQLFIKSKAMGYSDVPSASIVLCNLLRKEIVSYGDCRFMVDGKSYSSTKKIDSIIAHKRAIYLQEKLALGSSIDDLLTVDCGREFIYQDLIDASKYANTDEGLGFPVLNGGQINQRLLLCVPIDTACDVVMCSDGYPVIKETLAQSEQILHDTIQQDPLCIFSNKGTKAVMHGQVSYDDRSYIRIEL